MCTVWDPIQYKLILYLVYVLHWPDDGCFTAETCSPDVCNWYFIAVLVYICCVLYSKIHKFAATQRDGSYRKKNKILIQRFCCWEMSIKLWCSSNETKYISIVKPTRCTNVSNLFYFGMTLYMFRTVFPSIISSSRLYIQLSNRYCCLLGSEQSAVSVWHMPVAVCTDLNCWWWTERPSETCRLSFQNKINLIHWCIWLVLL